jgi:hypothetical protein
MKCDDECGIPERDVADAGLLRRMYEAVGRILISSMNLEYDLLNKIVLPRHGPGQTQERISGNQKWRFMRWHSRLEEVGFTYDRFGRSSNLATAEELAEWPELV